MSAALPLIKLDNFEGPFDLLLSLAAQQKIDVSIVSLSRITDAFLRYIEAEPIPPALVADFVVIASTVLLIKIRLLLPQLEPDEEELQQLSNRLHVYRQYRQRALELQQQWRPYLLPSPERLHVDQPLPFPKLSSHDLAQAMQHALANRAPIVDTRRHVRPQGRTLQECLQTLRQRLENTRQIIFNEELRGATRDTAAVSFLAVLELSRQKVALLVQDEPFAALTIKVY